MKKRFIIIVLDGFGIGAMPDAAVVRPGDEKANTLRSILEDYPDLKLPTLEKLGLMNAYGHECILVPILLWDIKKLWVHFLKNQR